MKKLLFAYLALVSTTLIARDNPFQPIINSSDINMSDAPNLPQPKYLQEERIKLPSSARYVRTINVEYKNVDGTVAQETLIVNKDIDWHAPIVVSHQALVNKKLVPPPESKESFDVFSFLKFDVYQTQVMIYTKDIKARDFTLTAPPKILLDFKTLEAVKSQTFTVTSDSVFKEINVGKYNEFYRVTLVLDGNYASNITKTDYGYLVEVR